jgi:hypothetical protein
MKTHNHLQTTPAPVWTINHGLGVNPTVGVSVYVGSVLTVILPQSISYPSKSQVVVTFSTARTGEARLA